jgi:hypothetical protein
MRRIAVLIVAFFVLVPSSLLADFSYTQTTRITGGSLLNMTRFMPGMGSIKEPQTHTIAVKNGKLVTYDKDTATIIDPDAETMTQVDFKKKQYSVITFTEMKQALQAMKQQMEQMQAQLQQAQGQQGAPPVNPLESFKISVNDTGQSKVISGLNTKQYILTMEMAAPQDAPAGLPPSKTTMDAWMAPTLPGYEEVTEVGVKMAAKMAELTPGMNPMAMFRPDVANTANAMAEEMSKMKGIPVYETLTMGGFAPSGPSVSDAVKDGAKESAVQGALGRSRLGGLGGALGGLGRRREEPPKQSPQQPQEVTLQPVTLLEQVTEITNLAATADASKFSVPAGFKQVENEMKKLSQRK